MKKGGQKREDTAFMTASVRMKRNPPRNRGAARRQETACFPVSPFYYTADWRIVRRFFIKKRSNFQNKKQAVQGKVLRPGVLRETRPGIASRPLRYSVVQCSPSSPCGVCLPSVTNNRHIPPTATSSEFQPPAFAFFLMRPIFPASPSASAPVETSGIGTTPLTPPSVEGCTAAE